MAKQRSSRVLYKAGFLNELREKVINKYLEETNSKGKYVLTFSTDKNSKYILAFKFHFNEVLGIDALWRFFYRELDEYRNEVPLTTDMSFESSTIDLFESYLNTEIDEDTGSYFLKNGKISGCEVIDKEFFRIQKKNIPGHTVEDFYMAKQRNNCQWAGIANDWHCKRAITEQVIEEIKASYSWEPVISVFVHGLGGIGKTTFLRQISKACVDEGLIILWLNSLKEILSDGLKNIVHNLKYLIIIDDLSIFEKGDDNIEDLFAKISAFENIKIIIADRQIELKRYKKYLIGNNYIELTSEDNDEIINKILYYNAAWRPIVESFPFGEIYKSSIFKILFVIAKEYETGTTKFTKGIQGRFVDIIEDDLIKLNNLVPGISKALYHLAFLYHSHYNTFTWKAFLKLANSYSGKNFPYSFRFDLSFPANKILNRYFSLEDFLIPYMEDEQVIYFHHRTLLSDGLCSVHLDDLYFDTDNILLEIIDTFYQKAEPELAHDILNIHYWSDDPTGDITKDNYFKEIRLSMPFFELLALDHTLEKIRKEANSIQGELFWKSRLTCILYLFKSFPIFYQREVLNLLISFGCHAECVLEAYQASEFDDLYLPNLRGKLGREFIDRFKPDFFITHLIETEQVHVLDLFPDKPPYLYFSLDTFNEP